MTTLTEQSRSSIRQSIERTEIPDIPEVWKGLEKFLQEQGAQPGDLFYSEPNNKEIKPIPITIQDITGRQLDSFTITGIHYPARPQIFSVLDQPDYSHLAIGDNMMLVEITDGWATYYIEKGADCLIRRRVTDHLQERQIIGMYLGNTMSNQAFNLYTALCIAALNYLTSEEKEILKAAPIFDIGSGSNPILAKVACFLGAPGGLYLDNNMPTNAIAWSSDMEKRYDIHLIPVRYDLLDQSIDYDNSEDDAWWKDGDEEKARVTNLQQLFTHKGTYQTSKLYPSEIPFNNMPAQTALMNIGSQPLYENAEKAGLQMLLEDDNIQLLVLGGYLDPEADTDRYTNEREQDIGTMDTPENLAALKEGTEKTISILKQYFHNIRLIKAPSGETAIIASKRKTINGEKVTAQPGEIFTEEGKKRRAYLSETFRLRPQEE